MKSVSTRLDDETYRLISETADKRDVSKAEVLRELVEKGMDYDELQHENERLRAEKRTLIDDREERTELVRYVEDELSYREAGIGNYSIYNSGMERLENKRRVARPLP